MPKSGRANPRFPSTPEIKRVLSALQSVGLSVGLVEIEVNRIRAFTTDAVLGAEEDETAFEKWKRSEKPAAKSEATRTTDAP